MVVVRWIFCTRREDLQGRVQRNHLPPSELSILTDSILSKRRFPDAKMGTTSNQTRRKSSLSMEWMAERRHSFT